MRDLHKELGKLIYEKRLLEISNGNNDAMIERIDNIIKKLQEQIRLDKDTSASE